MEMILRLLIRIKFFFAQVIRINIHLYDEVTAMSHDIDMPLWVYTRKRRDKRRNEKKEDDRKEDELALAVESGG